MGLVTSGGAEVLANAVRPARWISDADVHALGRPCGSGVDASVNRTWRMIFPNSGAGTSQVWQQSLLPPESPDIPVVHHHRSVGQHLKPAVVAGSKLQGVTPHLRVGT